ncbi:hypothetical protein DFH06DRAFT_1360564, partial [Mycena polygramma]
WHRNCKFCRTRALPSRVPAHSSPNPPATSASAPTNAPTSITTQPGQPKRRARRAGTAERRAPLCIPFSRRPSLPFLHSSSSSPRLSSPRTVPLLLFTLSSSSSHLRSRSPSLPLSYLIHSFFPPSLRTFPLPSCLSSTLLGHQTNYFPLYRRSPRCSPLAVIRRPCDRSHEVCTSSLDLSPFPSSFVVFGLAPTLARARTAQGPRCRTGEAGSVAFRAQQRGEIACERRLPGEKPSARFVDVCACASAGVEPEKFRNGYMALGMRGMRRARAVKAEMEAAAAALLAGSEGERGGGFTFAFAVIAFTSARAVVFG